VLRFAAGMAVGVVLVCADRAQGQRRDPILTPPPPRSATQTPKAPAADRPPSLLAPPATNAARTAPPSATPAAEARPDATPAYTADSRSGLKVSKGTGILPNDHGQVWREYDISPYTLRVRDVPRPEQAVIDWVLRETGTEVWFAEPLGILNASSTVLRVYHTPEMHERVRGIVERLVGRDAETHALGVRLLTVGSPNWRSRALALLKPVDVKSPGVEAWLLSRENAAVLYEQLKGRADFREHSAPHIEVANGQSQTLARTQARNYTRGVQLKKEFPFYDILPGKIDEGYSLEISPLMALDGQTIEAAISCRVDQIEKLVPLAIDVPIGGQSQRVQIQVPQMASWRLAERFRWPASEVLLLSCGIVASPAPAAGGVMSLLAPLGISTNRADALLMIEQRPPSAAGLPATPSASPPAALLPIAQPQPAAAASSVPAAASGASPLSRGRY
jgi:hypothetical protein